MLVLYCSGTAPKTVSNNQWTKCFRLGYAWLVHRWSWTPSPAKILLSSLVMIREVFGFWTVIFFWFVHEMCFQPSRQSFLPSNLSSFDVKKSVFHGKHCLFADVISFFSQSTNALEMLRGLPPFSFSLNFFWKLTNQWS